jgi:hypothetical protein
MAGLSEQEVRDRLRALCPPDLDPALTADDLDAMVRAARQADADGNPPDDYQPWAPGITLTIGALAVPVERDGYVYRVTARADPGASGNTEPDWPVGTATVTDGNLTWELYDVAPWTPTWSINRGAGAGWRIKAGKAAHEFSFSAGTDRFGTNELLDHCLKMAKEYDGAGIAVLEVRQRRRTDAWEALLP